MLEYFVNILSKPVTGLALLIRLFAGGDTGTETPAIETLRLVRQHDSMYVEATLRNGLTPEIRSLINGGVVISTDCIFTCGTFVRVQQRRLQLNPVKQICCIVQEDGMCGSTFAAQAIDSGFNTVQCYLANLQTVTELTGRKAKLEVTTTITVDALSIGKKTLWPGPVTTSFVIPALSENP